MRTGRPLIRLLLIVPLLAAGIVLGTPQPAGAATECTDPEGDVVFSNTTVRDSLVVPPGGWCTIASTVVRGGITVGAGAILAVTSSEVRGAISAPAPFSVFVVDGSVVRGSVTVGGPVFANGDSVRITDSEVRGDVVITNFGLTGQFAVLGNTVRDSVVLRGNVHVRGFPIAVSTNAIDVKLDCVDNAPSPLGHSNTVGGVATGQCAGLVAP